MCFFSWIDVKSFLFCKCFPVLFSYLPLLVYDKVWGKSTFFIFFHLERGVASHSIHPPLPPPWSAPDFSDAYIVVKGDITLTKINGRGIIGIRNRFLAFKNNARFTNCISKVNTVLTDNAKDLDVVMAMYNLLQYSRNSKKATGSLWNSYKDEPDNLNIKY